MDSPLRFTARQCDPISSSVLKVPCSSYHAPYTSTSTQNDSSRTMPRHKSLPSIQATMYSTDSSIEGKLRSIKKSESSISLRRSVSGMKSLLPLKLSSSLPTSPWNSPPPIQRSTFRFEQERGNDSILRKPTRSPKRKFNVPQSMTIRREQYRDTPVYTEPGSPLLNLAYYTDEEACLNSSSVDSSCDVFSVVHGNADSSGESNDGDSEDLDEEAPLPEGPKKRNRPQRSSVLSFECLGESGGSFQSLFRDEAAWLSSPLNKWNCPKAGSLPQLLAESMPVEHDIEGWLSDTSSTCGDDSYACATALTPTRATVVDVNTNGMSIKIPPRSSSLVGTRPQSLTLDEGRKSQIAFRDSLDIDQFYPCVEDDFSNATKPWASQLPPSNTSSGFSLPSPPLSPTRLGSSTRYHTAMDSQRGRNLRLSHELTSSPASGGDSIYQIISALDESTSNSPSSTLLPETPCISAIRIHLHQSSPHSQSQWDVPTPLPSPFSEGVDWRPRPNPSPSLSRPKTTYFTSLQRTFSSRTSKTVPVSKHDCTHQKQDTLDAPLQRPQSSESTPSLAQPDLQPLNAIFPNATHHLRSALYAHILAYLFVTSLPEHYSIPQTHTPPSSPTRHLPYYSTTSQSIPHKAANRLGISVSALPRKINVGDDAIILRQSGTGSGIRMLAEKLRDDIGWLIAEMSDEKQTREAGAGRVDAAFLRALGEVVKGCERDCFGYS